MQYTYFTPGPAQLHPRYAHHLRAATDAQIGSISHRSGQFRSLYQRATEQLRELMAIPPDFGVFFLGSATEVWERSLQNAVGDASFHLVNGSFSRRYCEFSSLLGKRALCQEVPFGEGFDAETVVVPAEAELVCLTHNETSAGVSMLPAAMHALRQRHPDQLFIVDAVSSAPYPAVDFRLIDSLFFSVQKAFGLPAGLGVWIVGPRLRAKAEALRASGHAIGTYHSLPSLFDNFARYETPETPNVLAICLLGHVAEDLNRVGIAALRQQTEAKATMLYDFATDHPHFSPFVRNPAHRSQTVIVLNTRGPATNVLEKLKARHVVVGSGYGNHKDDQIRIANFPATSADDVARLIGYLREDWGAR